MYKIADLTYAMNLGIMSRENSLALCIPYTKQAESALIQLNDWHKEYADKYGIDVEESRRKRQGIEGFVMRGIAAVFDEKLNYKKVSSKTISYLEHQSDTSKVAAISGEKDLFHEDVTLIAKEGKLYYLPEE